MTVSPCRCRQKAPGRGGLASLPLWSRQGATTKTCGHAHCPMPSWTASATRARMHRSCRCGTSPHWRRVRRVVEAIRVRRGRKPLCMRRKNRLGDQARPQLVRCGHGGRLRARHEAVARSLHCLAVHPGTRRHFLTGLTRALALEEGALARQGRRVGMTRRGGLGRGAAGHFQTRVLKHPARAGPSGRRGKVSSAHDAGEPGGQRHV